jgi:hypothetical protein
VADQVVREAADLREEAGVDQQLLVLREALEVRRVERVHLRLRLRESGTRLEPPDVPPVVAVAALVGLLLGRERERSPEADARRECLEAPRHHSDDGVRLAVDAQVLADRAGIGGEEAPPEPVAQQHLLLVPRLALLVRERAPERGCRAHHAQVRRRDVHDLDAHGPAVFVEAHAARVEERLLVVDVRRAQAVVVVGDTGVRAVARARARVLVAHQQDPLGLGHRQRPQQHVVDHGEERRVGGEAERQRGRRGQAVGLVARQEPETRPNVASEPVHATPPV